MGAKIIGIATQKGGTGKTTSTIEIGACMGELGKKVLLIDLDQQCNLSEFVGAQPDEPDKNIYTALHDSEMTKVCILKMDLFDVIPGSPALSNVDVEFNRPEDVFRLDLVIDQIRDDYDYVLLDNGPQRGMILQMTYAASDYIVSPCDNTAAGTNGIKNVYADIKSMTTSKISLSHAVLIGAIVTRYKNSTINKASLDILQSLMAQINEKGFVLPVRDSVKVSEAKYLNKSVQEYERFNNASIDYRHIAEAIMNYDN